MSNFRKIEKIIVANGWVLIRINGSHYQYKHPENLNTITIPNHNGKDLSIVSLKISRKLQGYLFGDNPVLFLE